MQRSVSRSSRRACSDPCLCCCSPPGPRRCFRLRKATQRLPGCTRGCFPMAPCGSGRSCRAGQGRGGHRGPNRAWGRAGEAVSGVTAEPRALRARRRPVGPWGCGAGRDEPSWGVSASPRSLRAKRRPVGLWGAGAVSRPGAGRALGGAVTERRARP